MKIFTLEESEEKDYEKWKKEHDLTCKSKKNPTAIGGRLTYSFIPTSIGTVFKVKCVCGVKKDFTDYNSW